MDRQADRDTQAANYDPAVYNGYTGKGEQSTDDWIRPAGVRCPKKGDIQKDKA
jgi:hypothetical protein